MNAGLVDLIATIRGIVRRPTDFTIQLFQILVLFIFFFYNSIFPFSSRCHIKHVPVSRREVFANCNCVMQTATTQPDLTTDLKLNYHGIIVDSDSALR